MFVLFCVSGFLCIIIVQYCMLLLMYGLSIKWGWYFNSNPFTIIVSFHFFLHLIWYGWVSVFNWHLCSSASSLHPFFVVEVSIQNCGWHTLKRNNDEALHCFVMLVGFKRKLNYEVSVLTTSTNVMHFILLQGMVDMLIQDNFSAYC